MTTTKQIEIAQTIADGGLVKKVFHSVQLLKDERYQTLYPAYKKGAEYTYTGIDDALGLFGYLRYNGDMVSTPFKVGSCVKSYHVIAPLRAVFFNDNEDRDFDFLTMKLSAFTFLQSVTLSRIVTDKYRLFTEESPLFRKNFDGKTFYIAIDFTVTLQLMPSDCEAEDCSIYPNPILPCPVVAQGSIGSATS